MQDQCCRRPGVITVRNLLEKYRQHLVVRNYSKRTIESHIFSLTRFSRYLDELNVKDVAGVTKDIINGYQVHLYETVNARGDYNSVSTQNIALGTIKSFFRFLVDNDYIITDPAKSVSLAKEPKKLPRSILTGVEAKKVMHAPDIKTILGYRDRTILEILYSSGIRKEELLNVLVSDIDYTEGLIRINGGKGKKDRVVPIGRIACRYTENYIKAVRPELVRDPRNTYLFLSLRGNRLSKNMVWEIVKSYTNKAKINKNISPHTFRHTCATLMLKNKANLRHIQELLGHSSLDSTQVYSHVTITDLKEEHARCHPRERDRE